jgi:outer membrane receptor protein involved in Fe transport
MKNVRSLLIIILILLCILPIAGLAQSVNITIKDYDRNTLPGATVQLTKTVDSTDLYATTNQNGIAVFENLENTLYAVKISFIGFETLEKAINIKPNDREFHFKLKENAITLDEVTIEAKTPLIRQEDDKMIIDPASLVDISSNTLEVLESVPGMYVDQDGGIFLNSATPAKVYINGREQKMSNQDISTILQSLPPGSVQKIEVMRTPSTKYDAASSGGIVNIVLKKGVKIGRFGSINTGLSKSKYTNGDIGFTINDSGDKSTGYLNVKYRLSDREEILNINRFMQTDTFLYQNATTRRKSHRLYTGYGVNYDFNERLNLSYDGRINYSQQESNTANTNFSETIDIIRLSENNNSIINISDYYNIQQDLSLNLKLDTIGSEWDNKFGYNYSNRKNNQDYDYIFTIPDTYTLTGSGDDNQLRHFISLQSDFTYYFPYKIRMETGAKSTYQTFDNNADFTVNYDGMEISDPLRTNSFNYIESINAAYLQVSKTLVGNFILKGGVRIEHTYMDGKQTIPTDTSFLINRADWFPYVYLSRTVFKMNDFELQAYAIYRRTISRPGYDMLNPNINFVDQFMYETGNPALKPQFTNNIEVNISYKDYPVFAAGQNYTTDIFSGVMYQSPDNPDIAVRTYDNLGTSKETYLRGMIGIPPMGRYFFAAGAQYNFSEFDGTYEEEPLQYTHGGWRFFTFHSLKLFGNTKLTMSGFMMVNGRMDFYELENFGAINIGLRQSFFNDKLTISIRTRDVLGTMLVAYEINQGSINAWGDRYTDNRRFGINIRYSFGFGKKKDDSNMLQFEDME